MILTQALAGALALLLLAGCATPAARPYPGSAGADGNGAGSSTAAGHVAVSVLATPLFIPSKAAVCAASLAIAVPGAAFLSLTEREYGEGERQKLDRALALNCGPPWVVP